jgi:hypothetical protein
MTATVGRPAHDHGTVARVCRSTATRPGAGFATLPLRVEASAQSKGESL